MLTYDKDSFTYTIVAGEDLSDKNEGTGVIYKAIDAAGVVAEDATAIGILAYGGESAEHVTVITAGTSKYTAAAAIVVGAKLTVTTSGYFTTAASGDAICGQALAAVTSGSIGRGSFNTFGTATLP